MRHGTGAVSPHGIGAVDPLLQECKTGLRDRLWQRIQNSGHMWR